MLTIRIPLMDSSKQRQTEQFLLKERLSIFSLCISECSNRSQQEKGILIFMSKHIRNVNKQNRFLRILFQSLKGNCSADF